MGRGVNRSRRANLSQGDKAVNQDLEDLLRACGIRFQTLSKSAKVKALARWTKTFPDLMAYARHGEPSADVWVDRAADNRLQGLHPDALWVLPDDASGMPSYLCEASALPSFCDLVSDTMTTCNEIVVVDGNDQWSAVFVNHGSPELVARYLQIAD